MLPHSAETPPADTPAPPADNARTYSRREYFLGTVHGIALPEHETGRGWERTSYELNVVDGWIRTREETDDTGVRWSAATTTQSRVRAVLDAAPEHADFIATAHLAWVRALTAAAEDRRAQSQRRALDSALQRHGLALEEQQPTAASDPRDDDQPALF
ncbi:hypothetical protein [Amycolatopsis sp. WGS_07]|uniref:hypothetical protein n=1 Tax=Amycolatopsis sp. WGS_07 TaxID=3076764 RepID=UPI00387331C8